MTVFKLRYLCKRGQALRDKCSRVVRELSCHKQWMETHVSVRVATTVSVVISGSGRVCGASEHGLASSGLQGLSVTDTTSRVARQQPITPFTLCMVLSHASVQFVVMVALHSSQRRSIEL